MKLKCALDADIIMYDVNLRTCVGNSVVLVKEIFEAECLCTGSIT